MVSNSNNVKTLCPLHPPLRLQACPQMVPLPLLAGLQATPLNSLIKILDTLNNPFSQNRNVLSFFCVCGHWTFAFVSLLSELGMMSPVWSVGSLTGQLQNVTLHFTTSEIEKPFFSSQWVIPWGLCWTSDGWGCWISMAQKGCQQVPSGHQGSYHRSQEVGIFPWRWDAPSWKQREMYWSTTQTEKGNSERKV